MTIYVLRYGSLLKIGFSSELAKRVKAIMSSIPGEVAFVGHMPGDRDVEAHLHARFENARFSGEWFQSTPGLEAFCELVLIKEMPVEPVIVGRGKRRPEATEEAIRIKARLREYAATRWPQATHAVRAGRLADALGWLPSRLRNFYYADERAVLRATEGEQLDALLIAPELRANPHLHIDP